MGRIGTVDMSDIAQKGHRSVVEVHNHAHLRQLLGAARVSFAGGDMRVGQLPIARQRDRCGLARDFLTEAAVTPTP